MSDAPMPHLAYIQASSRTCTQWSGRCYGCTEQFLGTQEGAIAWKQRHQTENAPAQG